MNHVFLLNMILISNMISLTDVDKHSSPTKAKSSQTEMKRWIQQLGDPVFKKREQATAELIRIGTPAIKSLEQAAQHQDREVSARAFQVLLRIVCQDQTKEFPRILNIFFNLTHSQQQHVSDNAFEKLCKLGLDSRPNISRASLKTLGALTLSKNPQVAQQAQQNLQKRFPWLLSMAKKFRRKIQRDSPTKFLPQWARPIDHRNPAILFFRCLYIDQHAIFPPSTTDAALVHLRDLSQLQELQLSETQVTDQGLIHLKHLQNLKKLRLRKSQMTDQGLIHLRELKHLERLILAKSPIQGAGLKHLQKLDRLRYLDLDETSVTDDGLAQISTLKQLQTLKVAGTKITDQGLKHLQKLDQLEVLDLSKTSITDQSLKHLHQLQNLKILYLKETRVSQKGYLEFEKMLPKCGILY